MNYFKFGLALNILKIQMSSEKTSQWDENIKKATIPNGRTTIAPSEFMNCKMLEKITIPSTVTEISEKAFANCTSLKSISIPSETTSVQVFQALQFQMVLQ